MKLRRILLMLSLWLIPATASAHHVVSEAGIAWIDTGQVAELDLQASTTQVGERIRASWQTLALRYEQPIAGTFSLAARVPWSHIDFDDGRRVIGLGDVEMSAKARVCATPHGEWICSTGIGLGFPTGVVADGLGAGHLEVAPFGAVSRMFTSNLMANLIVVHKQALDRESTDGGFHGAVVAPHTDMESSFRLEAVATDGSFFGKLYGVGAYAWRAPGSSAARLGAEAGVASSGSWRLSVRSELPVAGWHRTQLSVASSFAWMF